MTTFSGSSFRGQGPWRSRSRGVHGGRGFWSVYVVRAFVKLREVLASHTELARKLEALEKSVAKLDARTRRQFEEVYRAIRALMAPPAAKSRPIGFTADVDKDG